MWHLVEAIWYALLIFLKIVFWPAIIVGGIALIVRLIGKAKRAASKKDK